MTDKATARSVKVSLARGGQVHKGDGGPVLISRTGAVRLNESAAQILALCDGTRTREGIVTRIVRSRNRGLAADVRDFLEAARRRGWIVER